MTPDIRVQQAAFDPAAESAGLEITGAGAVATFIGLVRGDDGLVALELEHYPGMTEDALRRIAEDAAQRWALSAVTIVHRVGRMVPGERIVFVGAASRHRGAAIDAMHFMIDWLKTDAPFWKREEFADGRSGWVEERADDVEQRRRWSAP
ncbi:MAG: molybdenum cofactor biosynthesis protein MoaE [Parasphingopyxis sp.]|uniref:molybdenum cofactor biosynthesis protein MoaE n=1 Tax=Parasphingopyxis sp. TaxID=1920299 RepID=UPI003FA0D5FB